jgi:PAS domain S-box-containing protein
MSLRLKVALIVMGIFLFYGVMDFGIQRFIIFPSFLSLEQEEAIKDSKRVELAINREIYHLDSFVHDWASWDDTYAFVESLSSAYIMANLRVPTFTDNKLNLIYIYDKDGKVVWGEIHDLETEAEIHLDIFPKDRLPKTHSLISYMTANKPLSNVTVSGVYMTPKGPMIISSRPILSSSNEGPSRGSLIMGRFLTPPMVERLADQTQVDFQIFPVQLDSIPETLRETLTRLTDKSPFLIEISKNNDQMNIYTAYPDINGNSALLIRSKIPRKIAARGLATIRYALLSDLLTGLGALIVIVLLLQWAVLKPIRSLTGHAMEVRKTGDLTTRLSTQRQDEIGILAGEFDDMLMQLENRAAELEKLNTKLQEDIYKRRQAEEDLQNSRRQLRLFIDSSPDMCFLKDREAKYLLVNTANAQLFAKKETDIIGKTDFDLMPVEAAQGCKETDSRAIEAKKMVISVENLGERVYETRKIPVITDDKVVGVAGIIRDITERKQAEEALRESEEKLARSKKMESLGLLAGGVAHDLNNVLSGIVSYPELILMDLPEDSKLRKPIETIQESGHRAASIVQDLLTVARGVATTKGPLNLNDLIGDYLNSPEFKELEQFHPTVAIKTNLDKQLFNIGGSHVHLRKVVMNLVSNASEAIEGSGNVTISTMNRYLDRPLRGYDDVKIGEYVVMAVSDDGSGISSGDLERIFEPFYTKKVMGRSGTGLGLAVVWNVVQDHKGYIDVTSDESGTTFELYFLITRDEIWKKDMPLSIKDYKGNGETILIVDDVESQREISCKMLDTLGYTTKAVSSGEEAVEYLKQNTVDLLFLDMIMDPSINGRETYERIIKIHPEQKAIIVSGFTETDEVKETQKLGAGQYVKKPITLEKIGLAVKEELEK